MHVYLTLQVRKGFDQMGFAGGEVPIHSAHPMVIQSHLLKITRPEIKSDVNCVHADVSSFDLFANTIGDKKQDDYPAGDICCLKLNLKARLSSYHWTRAAGAMFFSSF